MQTYSISNHPTATSVTRVAEVIAMDINVTGKVLILFLMIKHYISGVYLPEMNKSIRATGDNTVQIPTGQTQEITQQKVDENGNPMVDENGEPIMEEVQTPIMMGDFDLWEYQWDNNVPGPTILQNAITQLDESGKINEKCNYQA